MSTQAALNLGLPPGFTFRPDDEELIELFLLPSVRGEPARFPGGVIIEDNSAANTLPWKLLQRHGIAADDEAYFFVRAGKARQDRYCDGGGTWVSQRPIPGGSCIGGEEIKWRKVNLNLHMGRGKSGSTGWVMHEYTLTEPPCPFLKICHIAFTGHGKDRKPVPDDDSECQASSKRARVEADANNNGSTDDEAYDRTKYLTGDEDFDQCAEAFFNELVAMDKSIRTNREATTQIQATVSDQDPCVAQASEYQPFPNDQGISPINNQQLLDRDPCIVDAYPPFPIDQGISPNNQQLLDQDHHVAQASAYQPLPADQDISAINSQQLPELDQDPCVAQAYAYQPLPTDQGTSPINQQWFLDLDQDPCVAHGSVYQPFPSDQGISPINQELPEGAYMSMTYQEIEDAQLQPLQSPSWTWSFS